MRLNEIPENSLVELHIEYLGEKHKVSAVVLYKYADTVYVSAIKNAGKTIPAMKLKNFNLVYKTAAGVYVFKDLAPRSTSFNGQKLYAIPSDQDIQLINHTNAYRLYVGAPVSIKVISEEDTTHQSCILKDISMTGMGLLSLIKIDEFAKIEISFRVNDSTTETLSGNIIHTYEFKNGRGYFYGCEFDVPNDIIGNYILKQQLENEILKIKKLSDPLN